MTPLKIFALALAFMLAAPPASAAPDKAGTEVYLAAMGENDVEHAPGTPLLLQVNVFNELKAVTVGSKGKPLAALVRFEAKDANGRDAELAIRPLAASADLKGAADLGKDRVTLYFGADPASLAALPAGDYRLRAFVKDASSRPVTVRMKSAAPPRDDDEGLYYRLDRQWDALLAHAQKMIRKDANDVTAHIYHGDALAGLGRGRDALVPYNKAMELQKAQSQGRPIVEAPRYVIERIEEILNGDK